MSYDPIVEQAHHFYEPGVPYDIPIAQESVFKLLEGSAHRYPDLIALDYLGRTITYSRVLDLAERAAQVLLDAGVQRGDVVAVALPNCPQAFIVFYACQRIGAVAAQHNPLAPAAELAGQLARHEAKVAIAWEKTVDKLPLEDSFLETVFSVDLTYWMPRKERMLLTLPVKQARTLREEMRATVPSSVRSWDQVLEVTRPIAKQYPHAKVDDIAVILHTGGTNGVPKSVPLTHRNLGTNVDQCLFWVWKLHEGAEVFYSLLPYFHAFGLTFFLLASVKKAATQVVLPKFDVPLALQAQRRRPVTFFVGVPAMFERLAMGAIETETDITSIRYAVSGAMPLSERVAHLWETATGGTIIEGYGLSETSPVLTGAPMSKNRRLGVLGLPFPSTRIRLVDLEDSSKDVADGEPGEIVVKGPQVFSGYLKNPQDTAAAFTEDGWFRTGDIAVNEDGYLVMADRRKELILSGGFNVYPTQVENAIRDYPGVQEVAVVGVPTDDLREVVTAALVMEDEAELPTLEQIREWAKKVLPAYALPKQLAWLTELPRNQLGKILRKGVKEELSPGSREAGGDSDSDADPDAEGSGEE